MGAEEIKTLETLSPDELPAFFRAFASRLEAGVGKSAGDGAEDLLNFRKISIEMKRDGLRVHLKMKVKRDLPDQDATAIDRTPERGPGKVKYKTLKKRMEKTFQELARDLKAGAFPDPKTIDRYMEDVARMISFPEKGERFYGDFEKACSEFRSACEKQDLALAQAKYESMNRIKTECHEHYK